MVGTVFLLAKKAAILISGNYHLDRPHVLPYILLDSLNRQRVRHTVIMLHIVVTELLHEKTISLQGVSTQSEQYLCCLLLRLYNAYSVNIQNFRTPVLSSYGWKNGLRCTLDRSSRDKARLNVFIPTSMQISVLYSRKPMHLNSLL